MKTVLFSSRPVTATQFGCLPPWTAKLEADLLMRWIRYQRTGQDQTLSLIVELNRVLDAAQKQTLETAANVQLNPVVDRTFFVKTPLSNLPQLAERDEVRIIGGGTRLGLH